MPPPDSVGSKPAWRPLVGLAAAAVIGAVGIAGALRSDPNRFRYHAPEAVDEVFAVARRSLTPGEHIGILVPGDDPADDLVRWYTAQYALAPAIVEPVRYAACLADRRAPACGLDRHARVLVEDLRPGAADEIGLRLGLVPRALGQATLLERAP